MIQLSKSTDEDQKIIVTLTELTTINSPYYLFVFKHIETKVERKVIYNSLTDDTSNFKYRFNEFLINKTLFTDWQEGQYLYDVYEQVSDTDESINGKNKVESGKMNLLSDDRFTFSNYNTVTTFKSYDGK